MNCGEGCPRAYHTPSFTDVILVFFTKQLDTAGDGGDCGIAKWAERFATDIIADVHQQVYVALLAPAMLMTMQDLCHPVRPLAAASAFATYLHAVDIYHACSDATHSCNLSLA